MAVSTWNSRRGLYDHTEDTGPRHHAGGRPGALKSHWLGTNPQALSGNHSARRMQRNNGVKCHNAGRDSVKKGSGQKRAKIDAKTLPFPVKIDSKRCFVRFLVTSACLSFSVRKCACGSPHPPVTQHICDPQVL